VSAPQGSRADAHVHGTVWFTNASRKTLQVLSAALFALGLAACGGPAHSTTSTMDSSEHTAGGGETHRQSTETTETQDDGSSTTETTSSSQTSTPAAE
jgi:hypothetical protein